MRSVSRVLLLPRENGGRDIIGVDSVGRHLELVKGRFQTFQWSPLEENRCLDGGIEGTLEDLGTSYSGAQFTPQPCQAR